MTNTGMTGHEASAAEASAEAFAARQEWLDAAAEDGAAGAEEAGWAALHRALREDRIAVRDGFQQRVMAALPEPAWQRSRSRGIYPALVAALLVSTLGATFLLSGLADQPLAGTGLAIADFASTTLLAGSGLLFATWVGLGFGLEELFARSGGSLVAFGIGVLFLNLLFVSLLRRRSAAPAAATADAPGREGG